MCSLSNNFSFSAVAETEGTERSRALIWRYSCDMLRRGEVLANIVDPSVPNRKLYSAEGTKCIAVTISTWQNCSREHLVIAATDVNLQLLAFPRSTKRTISFDFFLGEAEASESGLGSRTRCFGGRCISYVATPTTIITYARGVVKKNVVKKRDINDPPRDGSFHIETVPTKSGQLDSLAMWAILHARNNDVMLQ